MTKYSGFIYWAWKIAENPAIENFPLLRGSTVFENFKQFLNRIVENETQIDNWILVFWHQIEPWFRP